MNVNNNLQALQQIFASPGVEKSGAAGTAAVAGQSAAGADEATLSPAASLAAQAAPDSDVRMDKVNGVQQALAAGTYRVASADVADKLIASMLNKQ